jgi:hypothetical protein
MPQAALLFALGCGVRVRLLRLGGSWIVVVGRGLQQRFFFANLTTSDMLIFIPSSHSKLNFTCLEV